VRIGKTEGVGEETKHGPTKLRQSVLAGGGGGVGGGGGGGGGGLFHPLRKEVRTCFRAKQQPTPVPTTLV